MVLVAQPGGHVTLDALQVIVHDGSVCVRTLPRVNHLLPLVVSSHTDAGSENATQVAKKLGLWTLSCCKTGLGLTGEQNSQLCQSMEDKLISA